MTTALPRFVSVRTVADLLVVSRSTVNRLIADGQLPAIRVGKGRGVLRVAEAAVLAYLERTTTEPENTKETADALHRHL